MPDHDGELVRVVPQNPSALLSKGFWAVADQGLFAISNFFLNVMLARWLAPKDYGGFAVGFSVFLLLGSFHSGLLSDPMLVFGQGRYRGRHPAYVRVLMSGHWALVLCGSLVLACSAAVLARLGWGAVASALIGFALAAPFILLLWLVRRACYIRLEPRLAASGGVVYMLLMAGGLVALYQRAWLTTIPALIVMGVASLITSLWLAGRLGISTVPAAPSPLSRDALRDHWSYGRWAVATMPLLWISGDLFYVFLALWWGLEASAGLKAVANLLLPLQHMSTAMSALLIPMLVRARGELEFKRLTHLSVALLGGGSLAYWGVLVLFHRPVMAMLYGGRYEGYVDVLWMLGVVLLPSALAHGLGTALRSLERPDQVCRAYALSSIVTLTFGLWVTITWGAMGAAVGLALASTTKAAAIWSYYRQSGGSHAPHGAPDLAGAMRVL